MEGLGINVPTLIAQIVNFTILLGLLYLVAYKPLMRMLDERSRRVKESMEQADLIKEQAVKTGEEVRLKAQGAAREEAGTLITRAQAEIQRERDEAISELRKEFADLTILAAEKIIDRSLDKEAHRKLIDQVLKESSRLKKG